jgi:hypothetical protein
MDVKKRATATDRDMFPFALDALDLFFHQLLYAIHDRIKYLLHVFPVNR